MGKRIKAKSGASTSKLNRAANAVVGAGVPRRIVEQAIEAGDGARAVATTLESEAESAEGRRRVFDRLKETNGNATFSATTRDMDALRNNRDVSIVDSATGRVLDDNEKVRIIDGQRFHTVPNIRLGDNDLVATRLPMAGHVPDAARMRAEGRPMSIDDMSWWLDVARVAEAATEPEVRMAALNGSLAEKMMPGWTRFLLPITSTGGGPREVMGAALSAVNEDGNDTGLATWLWLRRAIAQHKEHQPIVPAPHFRQDEAAMGESFGALAAAVADARVLSFPGAAFETMLHDTDESIHAAAGIPFEVDPDDGTDSPHFDEWWRVVQRNIPEKLPMPFPRVAIVHGCGARMTRGDVRHIARVYVPERKQLGVFVAHVLDDITGDAWAIGCAEEHDGRVGMHCTRVRVAGQWTRSGINQLIPHVLAPMLDAARAYGGAPPPRPISFRRAHDRAWQAGRADRIPPPFYPVRTKPMARKAEAVPHEPVPHASPAFRFDVRAHDRVYLHRGPAPIDDAIAKRLTKRGYMLFGVSWPDGLAGPCRARGHVDPQPGEWLAIRVVKVRSHQKGPADGEYVPALREPADVTP